MRRRAFALAAELRAATDWRAAPKRFHDVALMALFTLPSAHFALGIFKSCFGEMAEQVSQFIATVAPPMPAPNTAILLPEKHSWLQTRFLQNDSEWAEASEGRLQEVEPDKESNHEEQGRYEPPQGHTHQDERARESCYEAVNVHFEFSCLCVECKTFGG